MPGNNLIIGHCLFCYQKCIFMDRICCCVAKVKKPLTHYRVGIGASANDNAK